MIGRGMRLSPGKIDCHVIDMVGVINKGIVTTPTLFGLDPFAIIEEASPDEMEEMLTEEKAKAEYLEISPNLPDEQVNKAKLEIKKITYTHYESIYDLLSDSRNESFIRQLSPYAWVKVGPDSHVLSAMNIVLRIDLVEDGWW